MKVFMISTKGDSAPIARKLLHENHSVEMYLRDKSCRKHLDPDIPIIKTPTIDTVKADLLVIEDGESGKFADKARSLGRLVIGGGLAADRLSVDRDFNERSLHGCGLSIAEENTRGMVTEVGGWFDGEKFLRPHLIAFKYYHIGTGDVGPLALGMGICAKYIIKSRLFNDVLRKTETLMKSLHYMGYVGIEGYINNDCFQAIKLYSRLKFPIVNAIGELHSTWGAFLIKLATKQAEVVAVQPNKIVVGVSVLLPEYFSNMGRENQTLFCASGQNIEEAKSKAYKEVARANVKDGFYRIDIGDNFSKNLERLKDGSWL